MADETDTGSQTGNDGSSGSAGAVSTLNDVYKEFNVEATADSFSPQRQQQEPQQRQTQQQAPVNVPDPLLDAAGFKAYQERQSQLAHQTGNSVAQLAQTVQQMLAGQTAQQEQRDISAAVQKVKEAGFEADDDFIEVALGAQARKDPRFLAVFKGRDKNPGAWNKALAAVANEMKGKYAFRQDANLADNVRAAKNSTKTTQSSERDSGGSSLDKHFAGIKDPRAFDNEWQKLVNNGGY